MTEVVTYYSANTKIQSETWIAYPLLPNGEMWQVRCHGATEQEAKDRAIALLEREMAKANKPVPQSVKKDVTKIAESATKSEAPTSDTPKYKGVYFQTGSKKWIATVAAKHMPNGKAKYVGSYSNALDAAKGYNAFVTANKIDAPLNEGVE